jgi:hypothetical protein
MHIHVHHHYPENAALAGAVAALASAVAGTGSSISALAGAVQALAAAQGPSAELIQAVADVKAGAQLNDALIPDVAS